MADKFQVVSWSLEYECPFRSGRDWSLPDETCNQLCDLRAIAKAQHDRRLVDGICVTGCSFTPWDEPDVPATPRTGFRIEDKLRPFGGLETVIATCGKCAANASTGMSVEVAGCFGSLYVPLDSPILEQMLWSVINQQNLEDQLRSAFEVTTPLWYGFWMSSPLRKLQADVLRTLLTATWSLIRYDDEEMRHFLKALDVAIQRDAPLHVTLNPPGHVDFGIDTTFAHCPRCKAGALVEPWDPVDSTEPYVCQTCGHKFILSDHCRTEMIDYESNEYDDLPRLLGYPAYNTFVQNFRRQQRNFSQQLNDSPP